MAVLDVLIYPHEGLRTKAKPITVIDESISILAKNMFDTMHVNDGIGLAATQVNVDKRIIVIDIPDDQRTPLVLINPEIIESAGNTSMEEGCLSLPTVHEIIERKATVTIKYRNLADEEIQLAADGLLAICIQHEMDHLNGIVFADYFSALKKQRIKKKLQKYKKTIEKLQEQQS